MSSHGTASFDREQLSQFATVSSAVEVALPRILHGIDPKDAIKRIGQGQMFEQHVRRFFAPPTESSAILRPTRLITIPQVPVNYDLDWNARIDQAGPNTGADWDVRKVGDLYVTERKGIVLTDIALVGFSQAVRSEQALDFAGDWQLGRTMNPYEAFALPTHRPNLHRELGRNAMAAVSLEQREFQGERQVCSSWWLDDGRRCDLDWFDNDWDVDFVFGIVRE